MPAGPVVRHVLDAFVVERFATMQRGLQAAPEKDVVVGQGATIVGSVRGARSVYLSKDVIVRGSVAARIDVVVGSRARVEGSVQAGSDVLCLHDAAIRGDLACGGRARLHGGTVSGRIQAGGDVEVLGETRLHEVRTGGRIRVLEAPPDPGAREMVSGRPAGAKV